MFSKECAAASAAWLRGRLVYLAASLFISGAVAGLLPLISCARTEAGLQRELVMVQASSNAVENLKQVLPYAPTPASGVVQGFLAVGGALLALWATHLQRSLSEVRNGKPGGPAPPSAANPG